jgi:hypothetical protein
MNVKQIADTSIAIFHNEKVFPIPMYWKDNHDDNDNNRTYCNTDSNKKTEYYGAEK